MFEETDWVFNTETVPSNISYKSPKLRIYLSGFVISKTKKIQRLSKAFSIYFQRLFKDLWEQSAVEKFASVSTIFTL
jgi:hypothetical protein